MAALVSAGCTDEPYVQAVVLAPAAMRDAVRLDVRVMEGNGDSSPPVEYTLDGESDFGKTLTILTAGRIAPITVLVDAFDGNDELVGTGSARTSETHTQLLVVLQPQDFLVNELVVGDQRLSPHAGRSIAVADDGSFLVAWQSPEGNIMARLFDPTTRPKRNAVTMTGLEFSVTDDARVVYPDVPIGGLGGTCDNEFCGGGLTCVSSTGLCHSRCGLADGTACPDGGTCIGGACMFE